MALLNLLSIARTALGTHQRAIDVAGHNIANANNDGYTRQRANLGAETPQRTPYGMLGRGVRIEDIQRQRVEFLDSRYRGESSLLGRNDTLADQLSQIESILGDLGGDNLGATLDAFWSSWGDLSNDPAGGAARTLVRLNARQLTQALHTMDNRIGSALNVAQEQIEDALSTVNALAAEIGELNKQIGQSEINGRNANDLRDRRDAAVDQIGTFLPVRTLEAPDGNQTVLVGDVLLVERDTVLPLTAQTTPAGRIVIGTAGGSRTFEPDGGRLSGYLTAVNDRIPDVRNELDKLVQAIVSEVNAVHRTGISPDGATDAEFFDPTSLTAGTIKLSVAVEHSVEAIAAGSTGSPGDGSVALAMEGLRIASVSSLDGLTMNEKFTQIVTNVGGQVRDADALARAQSTLVTNIETQRDSVHGVSVDEEMVSLISHQQAYAAAARMVTVADEMIRELLQMV
jgi:flagellar hook-associated protein 1 FlgK